MLKRLLPTLDKDYYDWIWECAKQGAARYDDEITRLELELRGLQNLLVSELQACENAYAYTVSQCNAFDILCFTDASETRAQCVYTAQQKYGVCCTTRILGIPIGGIPCCQSGLCSCDTQDITNPDNTGPQAEKARRIKMLKEYKNKFIQYCINRPQRVFNEPVNNPMYPPPVKPAPVSNFIQNQKEPGQNPGEPYWNLPWFRRLEPRRSRRRRVGDYKPMLQSQDSLTVCYGECYQRYELSVKMVEDGWDEYLKQKQKFNAECIRSATAEYEAKCPPPPAPVPLFPPCGPGSELYTKYKKDLEWCDILNGPNSSDADYIKNVYNPGMKAASDNLDAGLVACMDTFGDSPAQSM
jgi:hypothetical protein